MQLIVVGGNKVLILMMLLDFLLYHNCYLPIVMLSNERSL